MDFSGYGDICFRGICQERRCKMDIGAKIKQARMEAKMTQEQVAEGLGVSRQTISNWENDKTYPDIISVIKMSDLYDISLDKLLKEEKKVTEYVSYLDESSNIVKSNEKKSKMMIILSSLTIWAVAVLVFWCFSGPTDAMLYGLVFEWFVFPVMGLVCCFLIGKNDYWGKWKWICAIAYGLLFMLEYYATFGAGNMIATKRVKSISELNFDLFWRGLAVSFIGMGLGILIYSLKKQRQKNQNHRTDE